MGTMTIYLRKQGNINNFVDQKAGNNFESNFGNKGTMNPSPHGRNSTKVHKKYTSLQ